MPGPAAGQSVPTQPPNTTSSQNRPVGASGSSSVGQTTGGGETAAANQQNPGQQQQQGQSATRTLNNLPDDIVTRVYIPLYDPATVRRMRNIIQTFEPSG